MAWRILITAPYFLPVVEDYRSRLESAGLELVLADVRERLTEEELLPLMPDIDGVICGDDQFTERLLNAAPRLRVISKWGTGIDSIDTTAAAHLGIKVCNTPNAFTDCVADSTLGYILNFARLYAMDQAIRLGDWIKPDAVTLRECRLGVVGVGNIGKAVVQRAVAFGMTIVGYDPVPVPEAFLAETGLKPVSLAELLRSSDFVTLHCDLAVVHCDAASQTYLEEGCLIDRILIHGRKQEHAPMRTGLPPRINVGIFLCKDVNEGRLKALVKNLLANERLSRVVIRPHPKNLWTQIDSWIGSYGDDRLSKTRSGAALEEDVKAVDVVFGGNSSVLIDAAVRGIPSAYVDQLDHGSTDLHGFVAAGLVYHSRVEPDLDELLRFYQQPEWEQRLRTFANIDDDASTVIAKTLSALSLYLNTLRTTPR